MICRRPRAGELSLLAGWRYDYAREALNAAPSDALRDLWRREVEELWRDRQFVLLADGRIVAYAAFNAALPGIVQVGSVWTPPELRRRGYGRAVVAGALLAAREGGVLRAVLFTADGNVAARRAYDALGFRRIGDWSVVLFASPGAR